MIGGYLPAEKKKKKKLSNNIVKFTWCDSLFQFQKEVQLPRNFVSVSEFGIR